MEETSEIVKTNVPMNQEESNNGFILEPNSLKIINEDDKTIPKDTVSASTGTESNSSQQETNSAKANEKKDIGFMGKTKQWASNFWNSMKNFNIKNIFPKTEYIEYRNFNGDMVKIPKKKLPLKKKKINENVNNMVNQDKDKDIIGYHNAASNFYSYY